MKHMNVRIFGLALVAAAVLASACSRHDNFPPMIPVQNPPVPQNFTVTTQDNVTFDLTWSVNNPSLVAYYRLFTLNPLTGAAEPFDTTSVTNVQVNIGAEYPDIVFGVSSITTEHVESAVVYGSKE